MVMSIEDAVDPFDEDSELQSVEKEYTQDYILYNDGHAYLD
jgi:hypothetical protein